MTVRLRAFLAVVGAMLVTALIVGAGTPAQAASGDVVRGYDVTLSLDENGGADVELRLTYDFGNDPARGPELIFPVRYPTDDGRERVLTMSRWQASSSTGAATQVHVEEDGGYVRLRVGDPNLQNLTGEHEYVITYHIADLINPAELTGAGDELYYDVVGPDSDVSFDRLSLRVVAPNGAEQVACYSGRSHSTEACTSIAVQGDGTVNAVQEGLQARQAFTVVIGYPAGTFPNAQPRFETPHDPFIPFHFSPWAVVGGGGVLALGATTITRKLRRDGRDEVFQGLTPGLAPMPGQEATVGVRDSRTPVAVQFQPPAGAHPGQLGTLLDEVADPADVTATIIDLAVRGYLRVDEVPRRNPDKPAKDWTLVQLKQPDERLHPYEAHLFSRLFSKGQEIKLSELKTTFAETMSKVQSMLYTDVTRRGWFKSNPQTVRNAWIGVGSGLVILGLIATGVTVAVTQVPGLAYAGVALIAVGIMAFFGARKAPARTAQGSAVLHQLEGFKLYLSTAEAEQLRFEEGEDIFSRYLPYAVVFGVAERWAGIFAKLAAQGARVPEPTWYTPAHGFATGMFWGSVGTSFGSSMERFNAATVTAISAPKPSASGSSGFSSGGGFSGGGMGGGSVGRW